MLCCRMIELKDIEVYGVSKQCEVLSDPLKSAHKIHMIFMGDFSEEGLQSRRECAIMDNVG